MDNKRLIIILSIFTVIFTLMGGTLAYYNWQSADSKKTNVTFTANRNYSCGADAGGHITSSDVRLAPAKCTDSTYAIKRTITTSVTAGNKVVNMDLWLNVNSIDNGLANSANFKWVIGKNGNRCDLRVINSGDFRNIQNGKIDLFEDVEYSTYNDTYYLYIWLDETETNNSLQNQSFDFSIGGICTDNGLERASLINFTYSNYQSYFKENDYREKITNIYFVYEDDLPSGVVENQVEGKTPYALSTNSSRPITGYLIPNTDEGAADDTYKLYVSSKYKIYAGNLSYAFAEMTGLKSVIFDNFDTSYTTLMGTNGGWSMFRNCSNLLSLDLSGFNTSSVTNMGFMFYNCKKLGSLDLSNFDTSNVINMGGMFYYCNSLTSLDVSSFDVSGVTSFSGTFRDLYNLTTLDLSSFEPTNLVDTSDMFYRDSKLVNLNLSKMDFSNVTSYSSMFTSMPSNINVIVKDETNKTWIQNRLGAGKGTVTIGN